MAAGAMSFLYRRLGGSYPYVFLALELQSALLIAAGTLALFSFYYDGTSDEYVLVLLIALALAEAAIIATVIRAMPMLRPLSEWIRGNRDEESTQKAWSAAISLPLYLVKRDLPLPVVVTVLPTCIAGIVVLDLEWWAFFPLMAGALVALGYSAMLHYLAVEFGMRPLLLEINSSLSPRLSADFWALSLRTRLLVALPMINLITGLIVAALTSDNQGGADLGIDVLVALLVSTTISLELTVLFSKSILRPMRDLQRGLERVRRGDYSVAVPVTTGDEFGDLAASFNQMVEGLAERETIREAFGTYLDKEVAEYILSEGFSEEGVEVEVTVLFCDVRGFTDFASGATPAEVVAALNEMFEVIVPIISRHGGHVDKFEGDGLLAVFGAPQPFTDHADRGVRAACEIGTAINERGEAGELRVGVGVNTGVVIAGAIGGAGRLNFSVIGGAVNIAARVESATRQTGDSILITSETWTRVSHQFEAENRGHFELRGVAEPVALYAPKVAGQVAEPESAPAIAPSEGDGEGLGSAIRRRLPLPRINR